MERIKIYNNPWKFIKREIVKKKQIYIWWKKSQMIVNGRRNYVRWKLCESLFSYLRNSKTKYLRRRKFDFQRSCSKFNETPLNIQKTRVACRSWESSWNRNWLFALSVALTFCLKKSSRISLENELFKVSVCFFIYWKTWNEIIVWQKFISSSIDQFFHLLNFQKFSRNWSWTEFFHSSKFYFIFISNFISQRKNSKNIFQSSQFFKI